MTFAGRGVLLDVEGTTSSVRYVYDVLFPFARQHLRAFLKRRWADPAVIAACEQLARDAEAASLGEFAGYDADEETVRAKVAAEAERLMDADVKATGLKALQGLVWEEGYAAGALRSHVYADVPPALRAWRGRGLDVRIFSSGSVTAQKVFFAHTDEGDLLPLFGGHYDTTTGPKREPASYARIAADMGLPPAEVLFLSDVVAELDAAAGAGMATALVERPGNAPVTACHTHPVVASFDEVNIPPA